jgi:hypothetical protein
MVYVVSTFEAWYWQPILATKDAAEALAVAEEIGQRDLLEEKPDPSASRSSQRPMSGRTYCIGASPE